MLAAIDTRASALPSSPMLSVRYGTKTRRHSATARIESRLLSSSLRPDSSSNVSDAGSTCSLLSDIVTDSNLSGSDDSISCIRKEPFDDFYQIEEELGRGKFAVVRKCRRKACSPEEASCAAKVLRRRRIGKDCRADIMHEVRLLDSVRGNERFVQLIEVFESPREIAIVTEYAAGGELFRYIEGEERLGEMTVAMMMSQVLEGLAFLHDCNIVHMDIKPQNILLTDVPPVGKIKICDLGLARCVQAGEDVREIMGTPDYVAPEVLQYEPITPAADMWSIGVLAYVLLTGCSPFAGDTKQETFCNIGMARVDFPEDLFSDISLTAVDFISKLLLRRPDTRLTARQCLAHVWLQPKLPTVTALAVSVPIGSPAGTRRALTPSSDLSNSGEPLKKSRCDNLSDDDDDGDFCIDSDYKSGTAREEVGGKDIAITLSVKVCRQPVDITIQLTTDTEEVQKLCSSVVETDIANKSSTTSSTPKILIGDLCKQAPCFCS